MKVEEKYQKRRVLAAHAYTILRALEAADKCLAIIEDVGHGPHMDNVTVTRKIVLDALAKAKGEVMTPETFEAHGKTWTAHTPGDPMPCEAGLWVEVLTRGEVESGRYIHASSLAEGWDWDWDTMIFGEDEIIGWRYEDGGHQ